MTQQGYLGGSLPIAPVTASYDRMQSTRWKGHGRGNHVRVARPVHARWTCLRSQSTRCAGKLHQATSFLRDRQLKEGSVPGQTTHFNGYRAAFSLPRRWATVRIANEVGGDGQHHSSRPYGKKPIWPPGWKDVVKSLTRPTEARTGFCLAAMPLSHGALLAPVENRSLLRRVGLLPRATRRAELRTGL